MASRLSSLDALRGLTLFFLVGLGPVVVIYLILLAMKRLGIFIRL